MTSRERFHETLSFGLPDRVPYFEEGIREDVLKVWRKQGLPKNKNISEIFKTDSLLEIDLEFDPLSYFSNRPKTLNELSYLRERLEKVNLFSYWENYKKSLQIDPNKNQVLLLKVHHGLFLSMGIYSWNSFTDVLLMLTENPEFVRESMIIQSEFLARLVNIVIHDIEIDAVIFNEPIGGNEGPLISPKMYEEFVLKSYIPIIDAVKSSSINTIILRSYANFRIFIPLILKYRFNCLWACETNCLAMDYLEIRKEFGRDLRLIGGIDLDTLRKSKKSIKKELEAKLPPLIKSGGYIPLADGRIRNDISFENYAYYRLLLEKMT